MLIDGGFGIPSTVTCTGMVGSAVPHGGQNDAVEQAAVQPLGHLQSCPLHSDRGDKAQHDTQAAEYGEYHGIDRLVQGTFLSGARMRGPGAVRGLSPPPLCQLRCGLQSYLAE